MSAPLGMKKCTACEGIGVYPTGVDCPYCRGGGFIATTTPNPKAFETKAFEKPYFDEDSYRDKAAFLMLPPLFTLRTNLRTDWPKLAAEAYKAADAMLEARKREENK